MVAPGDYLLATYGDTPGWVEWARYGEAWIATTRTLHEPPLELIMAAPLAPVVAPFGRAARNGIQIENTLGAGTVCRIRLAVTPADGEPTGPSPP